MPDKKNANVRTIRVVMEMEVPSYFKANAEGIGRNAVQRIDAEWSRTYGESHEGDYIQWAKFVEAEEL